MFKPSWFTGSDELWQLVLDNFSDALSQWTFWKAAEFHKITPETVSMTMVAACSRRAEARGELTPRHPTPSRRRSA